MNALLQVEPWDLTMRVLHRLTIRRSPPTITRHQPRPQGVIRPGSATEAVLAALKAGPSWQTEAELVAATGRGRGGVSWSLHYLASRGLVRVADGQQRTGSRRYAAPTKEN